MHCDMKNLAAFLEHCVRAWRLVNSCIMLIVLLRESTGAVTIIAHTYMVFAIVPGSVLSMF